MKAPSAPGSAPPRPGWDANGAQDVALDTSEARGLTRSSWLSRLRHGVVRRQEGPVILMYHQVGIVENDVWSLAVSPHHFAEQLDVLARRRHPVPLHEVTSGLSAGALDRLQVAITFDDGYADNLTNAKPILEQFGIPATVFVVGDAVGAGSEFWWDALDQIFLGGHPLPETLRLRIAGREERWVVPAAAGGRAERVRGTPRERLRRELWGQLRGLAPDERWGLIGELQAWAGVSSAVREDRRVMTEDEVRELAADGLVEIGAHTATHPRLAALSAVEQLADIRRGKERLEGILGSEVTSFSYPFGGRLDVSHATVRAVRAAGFARACTTRKGVVRPTTNPFRLPRLYVGNWPGDEFARRLAPWL